MLSPLLDYAGPVTERALQVLEQGAGTALEPSCTVCDIAVQLPMARLHLEVPNGGCAMVQLLESLTEAGLLPQMLSGLQVPGNDRFKASFVLPEDAIASVPPSIARISRIERELAVVRIGARMARSLEPLLPMAGAVGIAPLSITVGASRVAWLVHAREAERLLELVRRHAASLSAASNGLQRPTVSPANKEAGT